MHDIVKRKWRMKGVVYSRRYNTAQKSVCNIVSAQSQCTVCSAACTLLTSLPLSKKSWLSGQQPAAGVSNTCASLLKAQNTLSLMDLFLLKAFYAWLPFYPTRENFFFSFFFSFFSFSRTKAPFVASWWAILSHHKCSGSSSRARILIVE